MIWPFICLQVDKLPGTDHNKEEQERQVEVLRQQLMKKTELLKKYKEWHSYESS